MSVTFGDSGLGTVTTFNDRPIYTCWLDGQTFDDPGVYAQHMLMAHGLITPVTNPITGQTIIPTPVNPVIPPPAPGFIPAPGVTIVPSLVSPGNFTPVYTPPLSVVGTQPYTPSPSMPGGSLITGSNGSATAWAWAGLIAAILANIATAKRSRKRG